MCAPDTNKIMHQRLTVMDFLGGKGTEMLPQTEYLPRETEQNSYESNPDQTDRQFCFKDSTHGFVAIVRHSLIPRP